MIGYIYTKSSENGSVFYVGSTSDLLNRSKWHKKQLEIIEEIEIQSKAELVKHEGYWIEQFRQWGFSLVNMTYNIANQKQKKRQSEVCGNYTLLQVVSLMQVFKKSECTIKRWIIQSDDRLTSDKAKHALRNAKL